MGHVAGKISHRTLGALLRTIANLPPAKQAMANRHLRSRFVALMTGAFKKGVRQARVIEADA